MKARRLKIRALGYVILRDTAQAIDEAALHDEEFYEPDGDSTSP